MTTPEIEELKSLIEQKYGKMLCTTTDFEEFSIYLKQKWGKEHILLDPQTPIRLRKRRPQAKKYNT